MDKMGSSEKSKTKGIPSSPRDGSAVELIGLQASVLRFLEKSPDYPYKSVERKNANSNAAISWTFKEWAEKIEKNFEKFFYVGENDTSPLVHKKGIYKDTVNFFLKILIETIKVNFVFNSTERAEVSPITN